MQTLKFSTGNGKLRNRLIFSLPAGCSCPHAGVCRTYADRVTAKSLTFLATTALRKRLPLLCCNEEVRPNVREARWHNWDLIRKTMYNNGNQAMLLRDLIDVSLTVTKPKKLIRVHESGDFWTEEYMRAWMLVAKQRPKQIFYAYTKSLNMWLNLKDQILAIFI